MRLLLALGAAMLPLASTAAEPEASTPTARLNPISADKDCQWAEVHYATTVPGKPVTNKLIDLPPGDLLLAVHREVDRCPEPVIVRHDIGGAAPAPAPGAPPKGELEAKIYRL